MPFYSDEVIKNIEEEFRLFLIDKSQYAEIATLISIIAPNNTLQTQLYHFAYHGLLRRIMILNRCVENIFNVRDFYLETVPSDDELSDIIINLQCFIINLYGALENLAWIYAICINFKGTKFDISFFAKQKKLLNTLPENIKKSFIGDGKWLEHIKKIRDLLYPQNVKIEQSDKLIETMANASLGLTSIAIDNCMAKSLVKYGGIVDQNCPKSILLEKKQILRKSGILEYIENNLSLEDVGGLNVLKKWLELRGNSFSDEARLFGLNPPKGVLLVGIPGCGKSLTAKCVASSWNMPLLKFDVGKIFGRWLGESEANMREALKVAEATAPCVLWIDEIEKGLQQNENDDGGTTRRVFGNILSWMQDKIAAVFVFATANNIKTLPPEFLRKGRFDEIFFVDLPSIEERKKIIEIHLKNTKRNLKNFDIEKLAQLSGEENLGKNVRLSGAEIEAWIKDSLLEAYSRKINGDKKADLSMNDLEAVIKRIIPMAKMRVDDFRELRSWARNNAVSASNISNTLNSFKKSF